MEMYTKASGSMISDTDKADSSIMMVVSIMENGFQMHAMGLERLNKQMDIAMKESGYKISEQDRDKSHGHMEPNLKVNLNRIKKMAMEYLNG